MNKSNNLTKDVLLEFLYILIRFIFVFTILYHSYVYLSLWRASGQLSDFSQQEYLRIKIYGSSNNTEINTVSATFSIVDTNGNEIATIERSWSGSYLAVDFNQTKINGKYFIFPSKIYGKDRIMEKVSSPYKGTSLEKYYNDNNQCMLLGYGSTLEEREALYKISRFSTKKVPVINLGYTGTYTIDLSECKNEIYYSVKKNQNGKLVLSEI